MDGWEPQGGERAPEWVQGSRSAILLSLFARSRTTVAIGRQSDVSDADRSLAGPVLQSDEIRRGEDLDRCGLEVAVPAMGIAWIGRGVARWEVDLRGHVGFAVTERGPYGVPGSARRSAA